MVWLLQVIYYFLPAGFANMAPVLMRWTFPWLAKPVDFGLKFRGKPIFGSHKTFRGLLWGILFGILMLLLQKWLYSFTAFQHLSLIDYSHAPLMLGFWMGFGAIIGDMVGSFFKRQMNITPGKRWVPFDQIDFIIGAIAFSLIIYPLSWQIVLAATACYFCLHIGANHLAYYLRIRNQKW
jgi:CDP-2,3-bis-(O-geranylgeranyl)-sn-glycerol synthase